jgi:hypothetical protein
VIKTARVAVLLSFASLRLRVSALYPMTNEKWKMTYGKYPEPDTLEIGLHYG